MVGLEVGIPLLNVVDVLAVDAGPRSDSILRIGTVLAVILLTLPCWNPIIIIEVNVGAVSQILQRLRQLAPRQVRALNIVDLIGRVRFLVFLVIKQLLQGLWRLCVLIEANLRVWICF